MEVIINKLGINGEGVTRLQGGEYDNKVCFVDFALPDEKVDIDIVQNKSKFCKGKLNKIISKSVDRTEARCPYFTRCGGCDIQHLEITKQREFKYKKVIDALRKAGRTDLIGSGKHCLINASNNEIRKPKRKPIRNIKKKKK